METVEVLPVVKYILGAADLASPDELLTKYTKFVQIEQEQEQELELFEYHRILKTCLKYMHNVGEEEPLGYIFPLAF